MKSLRKYLILCILTSLPVFAYSQNKGTYRENKKEVNTVLKEQKLSNTSSKVVKDHVNLAPENNYLSDTTSNKKDIDRVYDKLTSSKSRIVRNFANVILIGGDASIKEDTEDEEIHLSEHYFQDYSGQRIDSVDIIGKNIFYSGDSMSTGSWLERTVDKLHILTKRKIIEKYLLFEQGDTINPYVMSTNEYILRQLSFIGSAYILLRPSPKGGLIATVFTQDNWSIGISGELGDYPQLGLYDENFLGTGNRLKLTYLHPGNAQKLGGRIDYLSRNLWGKFIDGQATLGIGNFNNTVYLSMYRNYLIPGDSYWEIGGGYIEQGDACLTVDTSYFTSRMQGDFTFGKTFSISAKDPSVFAYGALGGYTIKYDKAPYRDSITNPYYADYNMAGVKFGIARQNYFQDNMVYSYGKIEDIPYGFKFELMSGWGYSRQIKNFSYIGAQARYGFYKEKVGFFDFTLTGSIRHLIDQKRWGMGSVDFWARYFSPLYRLGGGFFVRNFVTLRHTQGINRLLGEREALNYYSLAGIRGMSVPIDKLGTVRTIMNLESVIFSPYYFLHFRFAGFVWSDFGWLGNEPQFWKNDFTAAAGIGVRIKNERLIINNVEIRIGYAIKKYQDKGYSIFGINNEQQLEINSYNPDIIEEYEFK